MQAFGLHLRGSEIGKGGFFLFVLYFSYLMLLITLQYIPIDLKAAFLQIKQEEIRYLYYQIAFFTHVYTSIFVLLFGLFQFSSFIRRRYRKMHQTMGKSYVAIILFLSGPSGLIMGYHANGGWFTQISFCLLALFWIWFTYRAYHYARHKYWTLHRNFMMRSYALTLSAISLRLFKWIIVSVWELPPMDTYYIVAWTGWLVNWGIAEIIILYSQPGLLKKTF